MQLNSFSYSIKVWLTSVGLAPLMFLIIEASISNKTYRNTEAFFNEQMGMYAVLVVFGGFFSIITWLVFFLLVKLIANNYPGTVKVKYVIALIGIVFTFGTFAVFFRVFDIHNEFFYLMISNCICIMGGSLYYNLKVIAEPDTIRSS